MGERLAEVADQPLSRSARRRRSRRALRAAMGIPDGLGLVLGNGSDEMIQMLVARARARPGAVVLARRAVVRHVPDDRAIAAGMRYVGVPLARRLLARRGRRCSRRSREHRPALIWLAYPEQPDRQPVPARGDPAHRRGRARAWWWSTRPTTRSPAAPRCWTRSAGIPNLLVMRTCRSSGWRGCAWASPRGAREWIARARQAAPALQRERADAAAAPSAARARRRCWTRRRARIVAERARARARRCDAMPGVRALSRARPTSCWSACRDAPRALRRR